MVVGLAAGVGGRRRTRFERLSGSLKRRPLAGGCYGGLWLVRREVFARGARVRGAPSTIQCRTRLFVWAFRG